MFELPIEIMDLFAPEDMIDMSSYVDDCQCQCRQHITVEDGLLNVHGRPIIDRLFVRGDLIMPDNPHLRRLPDLLAVTGTIDFTNCAGLEVMPSQMFAARVDLGGTQIHELPATLIADHVDLSACPNIEEIREGIKARIVRASRCHRLKRIAPGLEFGSLDLSGTGIIELPSDLKILHELELRNCTQLAIIEEGVSVNGYLDVRGCDLLFTLPRSVQPTIAITGGMMIIDKQVVVPKMTAEEAAMCLGVRGSMALPHRHFKNIERMQMHVVAIERNAWRGRAVAALGRRPARGDGTNALMKLWVARLDNSFQAPAEVEQILLM